MQRFEEPQFGHPWYILSYSESLNWAAQNLQLSRYAFVMARLVTVQSQLCAPISL